MMKRNGFSLRRRTTICQKLPLDYEDKLVKFQQYVMELQRKSHYAPGQIGNVDETPVYIDMPRTCTVNEVGAREVRVRTTGYEKQRVTVMLCVTADGRKLPPYIILKRKNMPKNETFFSDVVVRVQEKGWMTSDLMLDWIEVVWKQRPGASLGAPEGTKSMLVLDAFRGHLTPEVKEELGGCNCDLVVVPGGITPVLQPLDVSINKPFKENLRQEYEDWIRNPDRKKTPTGRLQKASTSTVAMWISDAWKRVRPEVIVNLLRNAASLTAWTGLRTMSCGTPRATPAAARAVALTTRRRARRVTASERGGYLVDCNSLPCLLEFQCMVYFCIAVT